jgi:hypothetical protein
MAIAAIHKTKIDGRTVRVYLHDGCDTDADDYTPTIKTDSQPMQYRTDSQSHYDSGADAVAFALSLYRQPRTDSQPRRRQPSYVLSAGGPIGKTRHDSQGRRTRKPDYSA